MKKSRLTRWILVALVVAGAGYYGWQRFHGESRETAANGAQKSAPRNPVRVNIATVEKADFPVYLTSLGTVQAFNTVLVRSRVDGQIDLGQPLLLAQTEQHNPLRARGAAGFRAMIDVVAKKSRTFDQLGDELFFKVERHLPRGCGDC